MWFEHMGWPTAFQGLWRSALGVLGACLLVLCLAGLLATSAWPRMHAGPVAMDGGRRLQGAIAPLDGGGGFGSPAAAYSMRRLKSTYTGPAIRLRRASDNAEADINFLSFTGFTGAPIDTAAAAAHCAATSCFVTVWYDQSGNGRDMGQPAPASQPAYTANCNGTLPCLTTGVNGGAAYIMLTAASYTPATGSWSGNTVAKRTDGVGACGLLRHNAASNRFNTTILNTWQLIGGLSGTLNGQAPEGAWHSTSVVMAGAASVVNIDGVATTGSVNGGVTAGPYGFGGSTTSTCQQSEVVLWDNYVLTTADIAALGANQKSFWGTP